jgi:hypothetical protein
MRAGTRPIPALESEAEERRFWESHGSTERVDWGKAERVRVLRSTPAPYARGCGWARRC